MAHLYMVYLFKIVIFHGYVNNQRVNIWVADKNIC